jgi:hypothetical protein
LRSHRLDRSILPLTFATRVKSNTILHALCRARENDTASAVRMYKEFVGVHSDKAADPNTKNSDGVTPLQLASDEFKRLLEGGGGGSSTDGGRSSGGSRRARSSDENKMHLSGFPSHWHAEDLKDYLTDVVHEDDILDQNFIKADGRKLPYSFVKFKDANACNAMMQKNGTSVSRGASEASTKEEGFDDDI